LTRYISEDPIGNILSVAAVFGEEEYERKG